MSTVLVEDEDGVRTITLNRPERRNALVPEMQEELIAAFSEAAGAGARVIVLAGKGEAFCAGLDLSVLRKMAGRTPQEHRVEANRVARMFRAVWDCDVPTIAVVHRAAIAGGTGLAILCDFTLAGPEAQFGFTEARIGFIPALVGVYLALLVGDKVARGLLLSARKFDAVEALRLGLVNEVVDREGLQGRAAELAQELMENSPESLQATKRLLRAQQAEWLDRALHLAMEANAASRETHDFREGVASFLEKRKPVWKSRG
ncbi:enoyl-CoA hydratase/isomerase family protein [Granulicella sp. S156]|jgi:methylglutaconyl-CoA hydratase|uniref:enoyl-CoA hydratase/isomerase family protein n=1 Tax=Granulicella sp. S156 TaxID=1747224 RepID=UPI00131E93F0|nr:enoyl-CoA hydratase-related protein [Granulicella sp. S156]